MQSNNHYISLYGCTDDRAQNNYGFCLSDAISLDIMSSLSLSSPPLSSPPQVYANGSPVPFMVPPFATTPIYPVTATGLRPIKMEGTDW